jgi:hypothetical protein
MGTRTITTLAAIAATVAMALASGTAFGGGAITIRGQVVDLEGNPLPDAQVRAIVEGGTIPFHVTTSEKGAFAIRVPDWDDVYVLTFSREGYGVAEVRFRPNPDRMAPLTVTLAPTAPAAPGPPSTDGNDDPQPPPAEESTPTPEQRSEAVPIFNEGVELLQAGDRASALARFREASEIDPTFPEPYRAIAAVAVEDADYATAADAAEALVGFEPDNVTAIGTAYFSELMLGDLGRLIPSARRLAEANPGIVADEMLQHAGVLFDNGNPAGAKALLEVILEHRPDLPEAHLELGLACNALGDSGCAETALSQFLELAPDHPDADMARSLLQFGH